MMLWTAASRPGTRANKKSDQPLKALYAGLAHQGGPPPNELRPILTSSEYALVHRHPDRMPESHSLHPRCCCALPAPVRALGQGLVHLREGVLRLKVSIWPYKFVRYVL